MPAVPLRHGLLPQAALNQHAIHAVIVRKGEELVDRHELFGNFNQSGDHGFPIAFEIQTQMNATRFYSQADSISKS